MRPVVSMDSLRERVTLGPSRAVDRGRRACTNRSGSAVSRAQVRGLTLHGKVVDGAFHTTTFPVGLLWALQDLYLVKK